MSNMNESSHGTYEWDMSHIPVARESLQLQGVHTLLQLLGGRGGRGGGGRGGGGGGRGGTIHENIPVML